MVQNITITKKKMSYTLTVALIKTTCCSFCSLNSKYKQAVSLRSKSIVSVGYLGFTGEVELVKHGCKIPQIRLIKSEEDF